LGCLEADPETKFNSKFRKGRMVHACNPSYLGSRGRRIMTLDWPGKRERLYL
jgi:hypothetical protein